MSPMLARVMWAILLPPAAAMVYFATVQSLASARLIERPGNALTAGLVTWTFVAIYWFFVWNTTFAWTTRRRVGTVASVLIASVAAALVGLGVGAACGDADLGTFIATIVAPLAWLMLTLYAWRETMDERAVRLGGRAATLPCPKCGYDLTGLRGTRCPECGTDFTLDELVNARRGDPASGLT